MTRGNKFNAEWTQGYKDPAELTNHHCLANKESMKLIGFHIEERIIRILNNLVLKGATPNRSAFIRNAIYDSLEARGVKVH
jgi:hypothetical protein